MAIESSPQAPEMEPQDIPVSQTDIQDTLLQRAVAEAECNTVIDLKLEHDAA